MSRKLIIRQIKTHKHCHRCAREADSIVIYQSPEIKKQKLCLCEKHLNEFWLEIAKDLEGE